MKKLSWSKDSKNALLLSFMILLATATNAFACSVGVNNNFQKNLLIAK